MCVQTCVNGGSCMRPNHCACPMGWTGHYCQIDVDECRGSHGCAQQCVKLCRKLSVRVRRRIPPGGRRTVVSEASSLPHASQPTQSRRSPTHQQRCRWRCGAGGERYRGGPDPQEQSGASGAGIIHPYTLTRRKLEMVLAPLSTLFPPEDDDKNGFLFDRTNFLSDQTTFLSHSLRQLDRIDSLSEQVGFLEERLGSCSCQEN
ncbi:hypothetical protein AOLI_G00202250 [Acnodon oligacanthus]